MKNTKKFFSVALAGALAFGSMGSAFAAMPEMNPDTDKKVVEAVERLSAFGIVNGMDDGKYHEEMKVTREQFAKLLVEALGLGSAAEAAKGSTKFADVESSRWSSGYVNVAVGQGLIKGYPDGTFKPAEEVSYAEAVTMLVRALGYKDEFLPGTWPGNYVAKAADAKITSGAKFDDAAGKADRGTVALLVDNTLDAKVIKVSEYVDGTIKYAESDESLLEDKLDIKEYKNLRLVGNERLDKNLDSDELAFKSTKDNNEFVKDDDFDKSDAPAKVDAVKGLNSDELMGLKVKVYVNDDDEVVFMQREGNETVAVDVIKSKTATGVELLVKDEKYDLQETGYITGTEAEVDNTLTLAELTPGMMGKFIIEGNEVVFADVVKPEVDGLIVKSIDEETKEIKGMIGTDDKESVNLEDDYDAFIIRDVNGKTLELEDIKENNVVYIAQAKIDGDNTAIVTVLQDNVVKGKLNKVKSEKIEIGDKEFDLAKDYATDTLRATFSVNEGKDIENYSLNNTKLQDADEAEVVAVTDIAGRVLYFSTDVETTSEDIYAVVTRTYADKDRIKVYIPSKDEEVTYVPEKESDIASLGAGTFIKFSLNKDGEIAEGSIDVSSEDVTLKAGKLGENSITLSDNTVLAVSKDSLLISEEDATGNAGDITTDTEKISLIDWEDIKEDTVTAVAAKVFKNDKDEIEAIMFLDDGIATASDSKEAAYVIDTWKKGDKTYVQVALGNGEVKEYELDGTLGDGTVSNDENGYVIEFKSNGKLSITTDANFSRVSGAVYDKDGDYIKLFTDANNNGKWDAGETIGTTYYRVNSDAVIYKEADKKRMSNVTEGTKVEIIVENGKEARVIEIQ